VPRLQKSAMAPVAGEMTKLLRCNGHVLEVFDISPPTFRLSAVIAPIKMRAQTG
jgi:hypothetical protein